MSTFLLLSCFVWAIGSSQGYDGAFEQRKIAAAEVCGCTLSGMLHVISDSCCQFALEELRKTSDTGVYDSLRLLEVLNAKEEVLGS